MYIQLNTEKGKQVEHNYNKSNRKIWRKQKNTEKCKKIFREIRVVDFNIVSIFAPILMRLP